MKWYQNIWIILILIACAPFTWGATGILAGLALASKIIANRIQKGYLQYEKVKLIEETITIKNNELAMIDKKIENSNNIFSAKKEGYLVALKEGYKAEGEEIISAARNEAATLYQDIQSFIEEKNSLNETVTKLNRQVKTQENKLIKLKAEFQGITNLIESFPNAINLTALKVDVAKYVTDINEAELFKNLVELDCHYLNSKDLRKKMNIVKKQVDTVLDNYVDRYATKANRTIYRLLVIGLQAELQNIIYTLSYSKLEEAKINISELIRKYLAICTDGNANILPTITRFLLEIEPLFLEAVEIEYHFYHKREQEREEQRLIREQMRQEAAERKLLAEQQKKIEQEEEKYNIEMKRNQELLANETDNEMISTLEARILELEQLQNKVAEEKDEILKRANGKAGYVYIISNLGSFGDHKFKIGMTRRMEPMDRIDELGSASVPFRFDVHAMIFSEDAVSLEKQLHDELDNKRVNKVNLRKEFFETSIDELEELVTSIDPTVEFRPTLTAQEYRRSLELEKEIA